MQRLTARIAPLALAFVLGASLAAPTVAGARPAEPTAPTATSAPADRATAAPAGSAYVALTPCRVLDTRVAGGPLVSQERRSVQVAGTGLNFAAQGGAAAGCGVPDGAVAVEASITAVSPSSPGFLRAWPADTAPPTATVLNFARSRSTTNTAALTLASTGVENLTLKSFGGPTHYVIDVQGYFAQPTLDGSVYVPTVPCRVLDTRSRASEIFGPQEVRGVQVAGARCGVPEEATAVETSISAVTPRADGFLRAWPGDRAEPSATVLNFSARQGTTNTGTITLPAPGSDAPDLLVKNLSGPTHYVIDVQGFFVDPYDRPFEQPGSLYHPLRPCRVLDTRGGRGGTLAANDVRYYQVAGSGATFASQGGHRGGCAIPSGATAAETSISAVSPTGDGFTRAWPTNSAPPTATILNYSRTQGTTNTGATTLAPTTPDLRVANFGGRTHYVADVQGYYRPRPTGIQRIAAARDPHVRSDITADGNTVAFASRTSDLVPGDVNGEFDIYVWDREGASTTRITDGNDASLNPSVSADGNVVVFESHASDLVADDNNETMDVFLWDRPTGEISRISSSSDGYAVLPVVSADGSTIAYIATDSDLVPDDDRASYNIYVYDRDTDATVRITDGNYPSSHPSISGDGASVVFSSNSSDLVPGDDNYKEDVFLWERGTGATTRITDGNGASNNPFISDDGSTVALTSQATDLGVGDTQSLHDVLLWDRASQGFTQVTLGNGPSFASGISRDGAVVLFSSSASDLTPEDPDTEADIFVWDSRSDQTTLISGARGPSEGSAISANATTVVYYSNPTNLPPGDPAGRRGIFLYGAQ